MSNTEFKPKSLLEAIESVISSIKEQNETSLFNESEDDFVIELHHTLGRWIRNNWGLWEKKGELYDYFISIGLHHPDDMSSVILTSTWRTYHNDDMDVDSQVKGYIAYWAEANKN